MKRNTLLAGLVVALPATVPCCAVWAGDAPGGPPANAQVAVASTKLAIVVSEIGTSRGAVDIAYPPEVSTEQIEVDVTAFAANTGWQPGPTKWRKAPDATTIHFALRPGPHAVASQGLPIWPLLLTFRAYTNIEAVYLGIGDVTLSEQFSNRFVDYTLRGSGGIATYCVTIKDSAFASVAELSAPDRPGAAPATGGAPPDPGALVWALLGLVAVTMAGATYWVSLRATRARARR